MTLSSEKKFGLLFFIVFLVISLWPLLINSEIRAWSLIISLFFLFSTIFSLKLLIPMNKLWIKFGKLLGKFIAPVVLSIIYFFILTPIGLFMRIIRKDLLNLKFTKQDSYWIKKQKTLSKIDKQF